MLQPFTVALLLTSFLPQATDDGVELGALALRQFVGSKVVVDSAAQEGVDVVGMVEDLVLDIETGIVTRALVRDVREETQPNQEAEAPPLRSVSLDSLSLAASGGRALITYAYSIEDYRNQPVYDPEKVLRPEEGQEARLFTATDVGRLTVKSGDGAELGAIRDLWVDLARKRVDFIEHAVGKGHAAAPWTVMEWARADGKLSAAKIAREETLIRSVPKIDVETKHTLKHRDYRNLVYSAYGVKKEPDTSLGARTFAARPVGALERVQLSASSSSCQSPPRIG